MRSHGASCLQVRFTRGKNASGTVVPKSEVLKQRKSPRPPPGMLPLAASRFGAPQYKPNVWQRLTTCSVHCNLSCGAPADLLGVRHSVPDLTSVATPVGVLGAWHYAHIITRVAPPADLLGARHAAHGLISVAAPAGLPGAQYSVHAHSQRAQRLLMCWVARRSKGHAGGGCGAGIAHGGRLPLAAAAGATCRMCTGEAPADMLGVLGAPQVQRTRRPRRRRGCRTRRTTSPRCCGS